MIGSACIPSTTTTVPPDIRQFSCWSVEAMWNIGAQAMKASVARQSTSMRAAAMRAIIARWLTSAPFGSPVVPEV